MQKKQIQLILLKVLKLLFDYLQDHCTLYVENNIKKLLCIYKTVLELVSFLFVLNVNN
jgi:hypothetical protein